GQRHAAVRQAGRHDSVRLRRQSSAIRSQPRRSRTGGAETKLATAEIGDRGTEGSLAKAMPEILKVHNYPIQKKLTWLNMLVSGGALIVASTAFVAYELSNFRQNMVRNLSIHA